MWAVYMKDQLQNKVYSDQLDAKEMMENILKPY